MKPNSDTKLEKVSDEDHELVRQIDLPVKKETESIHRINTVFVVPSRTSKTVTLRKLRNRTDAEIIDASLYVNSSSKYLAQSSLPGPKTGVNISVTDKERTVITESSLTDRPNVNKNSSVAIEHDKLSFNNTQSLVHASVQDNNPVSQKESCTSFQSFEDLPQEVTSETQEKCEVILDVAASDKSYNDSHEINEEEDNFSNIHENFKSERTGTLSADLQTYQVSGSASGDGINATNQEIQLQNAVRDVLELKISTRRAAHVHGIRHRLLLSKISKQLQLSSSKCGILGADPALTEQEELQLVEWIRSRYKNGCPVKKIDLINRVSDIVSDGRTTRFKDGIPGEKWFNNFLARNPSVSTLGPAARLDSREVPSKRSIISWFKRCMEHLRAFGQEHLLTDPRRIGNVEKLTLCLVTTKTEVTGSGAISDFYLPEESSGTITVLVGACADGKLTPPMPVFSCRKPPPSLINSIPSGWGIGLSKDGNINKEVVHSYFKNILLPWLIDNDRLPFILFIDKLKAYLTVDITDFCSQKGLLIYNFYPNSCDVIQPLHKSVTGNIKKSWNALSQHKNEKEALLKFCPKLNHVLNELASQSILIKSFVSSGLYPFNHRAPDYSNCPVTAEWIGNAKSFKSSDYTIALDVFEDIIGKTKTHIFRETQKGIKLLKSEDKGLYRVWHQLRSKVDVTRDQNIEMIDYRHEKIVRGAFRKLPRPETYLMVADENNCKGNETDQGCVYNFDPSKFSSSTFGDDDDQFNLEPEMLNAAAEDDADSIDSDDVNSSAAEDEGNTDCLTSDNWKIRYSERDLTSEVIKVRETRKRERVLRKRKQINSTAEIDESVHKKLKEVLTQRTCSQCFEDTGKLIRCMVCMKYIHFECMMGDEQQIMSDLYEDNVAFDYICPSCSS